MKKIYRYFIPGIIVICLISGFVSAISIDSDNSTFISIPAQNSDQSNPSFSQIPYVNEYVIGNWVNRMIGAPPPTGYSYILYPPSNPFFSKEFNLTGFVDVWSPTDYFNGGPRPLESTHMLPIDWKFDANGVVMPATEGEYVYKETDTAYGDCGQMLTYNT